MGFSKFRILNPIFKTFNFILNFASLSKKTKTFKQPNIVMSDSSNHPRFLHSIFGDGKAADMMSWKNTTESAAMLAGITGVWLLVVVLDYNFVTLVCHLLIIIMLLLFSWNKLALFTKWSPPNVKGFEISYTSFTHLFDTFNRLLHGFFEVSNGHDFKLFAMVMGSIWLISLIGEVTNSLNLMYIVFVSLQIIPVLYDKYEEEFHEVVSHLKSNMAAFFHRLDSNFLSKIPRRDQIKQS